MTRPAQGRAAAAGAGRFVVPRRPLPRERLALSLQIAVRERAVRELLQRHRVGRWLRAALRHPAEIAVRVVDEDEGLALNRDFRGQDHATNVLTFDYAREPLVMADLVLCAPVVAREAKAQGITLADHYAHLLVHGALHAQGLDHLVDHEAEAMETAETAILARLGIADPYAAAAAAPRSPDPSSSG